MLINQDWSLELVRLILRPIVTFFTALIVSGVTTSYATEFLKHKWIPLPVGKYPKTSAALISIGTTIAAIYTSGLNLIFTHWLQWVAFGLGVFIVSAITFKTIVKGLVPKGRQS